MPYIKLSNAKNLVTILLNDRYLIYVIDWCVYDTETKTSKDIPQWVFEFVEKLKEQNKPTKIQWFNKKVAKKVKNNL